MADIFASGVGRLPVGGQIDPAYVPVYSHFLGFVDGNGNPTTDTTAQAVFDNGFPNPFGDAQHPNGIYRRKSHQSVRAGSAAAFRFAQHATVEPERAAGIAPQLDSRSGLRGHEGHAPARDPRCHSTLRCPDPSGDGHCAGWNAIHHHAEYLFATRMRVPALSDWLPATTSCSPATPGRTTIPCRSRWDTAFRGRFTFRRPTPGRRLWTPLPAETRRSTRQSTTRPICGILRALGFRSHPPTGPELRLGVCHSCRRARAWSAHFWRDGRSAESRPFSPERPSP